MGSTLISLLLLKPHKLLWQWPHDGHSTDVPRDTVQALVSSLHLGALMLPQAVPPGKKLWPQAPGSMQGTSTLGTAT